MSIYLVLWRWPSGHEMRCGPMWCLTRRGAEWRLRRWTRLLGRHGAPDEINLRVEQLPVSRLWLPAVKV